MARTRSKAGAAGTAAADGKSAPVKQSASIYTLPAESDNPPRLFILPKTASPDARVVTLQHPRYNKPTRYLVCPEAGFFEFTQITPPKSAPRSWLIQPSSDGSATSAAIPTQTVQSPALYLATPFDPLFLVLPALAPPPGPNHNPDKKRKPMFLSPDVHLDALPDPARHLAEVLATWPSTRRLVEARLAAVCDSVQVGGGDGGDGEAMYRLSERRLLAEVLGKARRMAAAGRLPGSVEERFVRRALEAPVVGVRARSGAAAGGHAKEGGGSGDDGESEGVNGSGSPPSTGEDGVESQTSASSAETAASSGSDASAVSTAATSAAEQDGPSAEEGSDTVVAAMTASEEVVRLQRLRVAFDFICSSYIAPPIAEVLKASLAKATDLVDFAPLDEYVARLTKLREEAAAARSNDFSRKRATDEEDDERAEKRRKKEAEEKVKKANQSRGVRELMKVNTSGMKKLSEFFKKKT